MRNCWTICGSAISQRLKLRRSVAVMLLTLSILLVSLGSPSPTYSQESAIAGIDSLDAIVEELADEVRALEVDLGVARIDVDEARKLHEIDKYYWGLREQMYERALADAREPWYERLATHPVVWVTIGMLVGVQASQ